MKKQLVNFIFSMKHLALIAFVLLPFACFAQTRITGIVINSKDKQPIVSASVYLTNTTIGVQTNADGTFALTNIPAGQYELIASFVGFDYHMQTVLINGSDIKLPAIELTEKTKELKVVTIRPDVDWARNYDNFKIEFLGRSDLARQCKILNPNVLSIDYDKAANILTASSSEFLLIDNKALGYRIKYMLTRFVKDDNQGEVSYQGSALIENLKGSNTELRRWKRKRAEVYAGSSMRFLRAVIANKVAESDFQVYPLIRSVNKNSPGLQEGYVQTLVRRKLEVHEYISRTDNTGLFAIKYPNCLYIDYNKTPFANYGSDTSFKINQIGRYATIADLKDDLALFDRNGNVTTPGAIIFEGVWGQRRIAELLPMNFDPKKD
ncbi:carboxypeptidase-like regulatory domain-containing protein [Mucilaginibacter glaciei]|uniref:Carboxypeptidase-like regulatory domain-containing protein n=1 Tax=Mucilaginibacter glaciei TaxID=2772109 RepID=A0A926NUL5_9SPHI|nr:carboxypeptidase-like regulatory domain-containing protein [Mucilaginibacter glaciei]MBD1394305.1 carboxypeptidase-like regulatory domain-containing protein [Mucilaginibacter glaciei]